MPDFRHKLVGRLYLLVVRSSHEDLPYLQRDLALVEPVARKHLADDPPGKDRRCPICLG
jgi:hypothetical protein